MLISYNWLRELVPALSLSPQAVAEQLTDHSFETAVSHSLVIDPRITVAKIIKLEPHPNADRLQLATVDLGQSKTTVVCGAANIKLHDLVPYAPLGANLMDHQGEKFTLQAATIRDVVSAGMLTSPRELGLGENHQGIYLLPPSTPIGTALSDHLPDDTILDADITPNRAHDCLSHIGIARDLAAILKLPAPIISTPPLPELTAGDWRLDINLPTHVLRYIGLALDQVQVQPSPLWLQARLWALGSKPINNVVDVTNYVLFETGYPSHAFDSHQFSAPNIGVRFAQAGDSLTTLDNNDRPLVPENLMITSTGHPVAIAGVIGGQASEVTGNTSQILLETAVFHPYTIQQSAAAQKISTESSRRFSKGLTPVLVDSAASRAATLLREIAGARLINRVEYYPQPAEPRQVTLNLRRIFAVAGQTFTKKEIKDSLTRLRCQVKTGKNWTVTIPPDRLDLSGEHDLAEEVIRLHGLQTIGSNPPRLVQDGLPIPTAVQWREITRNTLVALGLTETYNYSFADLPLEQLVGESIDTAAIPINNAIAPQQSLLRRTLLPRVVGNLLSYKSEWRSGFASKEAGLFEIGIAFHAGAGGVVRGVVEEEHVAIALIGEYAREKFARDIIANICRNVGVVQPPENIVTVITHPASSVIRRKFSLPTILIEINLSALITHSSTAPDYIPAVSGPIVSYRPASKFPPVYRDLSLLVESDITSDQIETVIRRVGGDKVTAVDLFDQYQPANSSQKGLAFHVAYQARDRTMNDAQVNSLHNNIIAALQKVINAQLR
jgi:phenylalanyl-tRNA synthetase beta chain